MVSDELDLWKNGIALAGMVLGALITGLWGYLVARRKGLTSATLDDIKDRASFRKAMLDTVEQALDQVRECSEHVSILMKEKTELTERCTRLEVEKIVLLARLDNFEERLARHELLCGPKVVEG